MLERKKEGCETMKRVQRKRVKGWKMPANTVYVGRPSKWRNPYYDNYVATNWHLVLYERWLREKLEKNPHFLDSLKGKDLACWCPLDKPCHADVLLKFLEEKEVKEK